MTASTDRGIAYICQRLADAPDLAALKRVWESISPEDQRKVFEAKERAKKALTDLGHLGDD